MIVSSTVAFIVRSKLIVFGTKYGGHENFSSRKSKELKFYLFISLNAEKG